MKKKMNIRKKLNVRKIVGLGMLTAIVIVFQLISSFIKVGQFSITLVLIPIVLGASLYGYAAGAWLGFVFSLTVLLSGDAAAFLAVDVIGTIVTVIAKGTLAGLIAGVVYKLLCKKNRTLAVAASSVICPIVNTGIFLIGCVLFFMPTIRGWAAGSDFGANVIGYMFIGLAGINFLLELGVNIILNPAIHSVINLINKKGDRL